MFVIFRFESFFHGNRQFLSRHAFRSMVKEYVRLRTPAAAVHMQEYSPAILILPTVFPVEFIDFGATLLQAGYLIQRNGIAHARFPLTVGKVAAVADSVFGILNDDMHFRPFLHQVTGKAQGNIIGIFILVQFHLSYFSDSSGIGTAMPADHIEASTLQAVGRHWHIGQLLPEQPFANHSLFTGNSFGRNGGRSPFLQGRQYIFHTQSQFLFSTQTFFVQLHKLIIVGFSRTFVPFQKRRNTLARFGCGIFSLSRDIQKKKSTEENSKQAKYTFHIPVIRHLFRIGSRFSTAKL